MKLKYQSIILLFAIGIVAFLFYIRINKEQDETDKLSKSLSGLEKMIPINGNITIKLVNTKVELWCWARYLFAPRYIASKTNNYDSVLTIGTLNLKDSLMNVYNTNRKIIWQNSDDQYCYFLSCKQ